MTCYEHVLTLAPCQWELCLRVSSLSCAGSGLAQHPVTGCVLRSMCEHIQTRTLYT